MQWLEHDAFLKEAKALSKRYKQTYEAIRLTKLILSEWASPIYPNSSIDPSKLSRITRQANYEIWKFEMAIPKSGLRPGQWPRVWFAIERDTLALLLLAVHGDNYDNATCNRAAIKRYEELKKKTPTPRL